ncbi:hypothetical protein ACPA9J_04270 [Pseudomonas aeruginosa]
MASAFLLRNFLARPPPGQPLAGPALAGLGITGLLQEQHRHQPDGSVLHCQWHLGLAPALAVMLGANVGTTLVVQLLSFDTSLLRVGAGPAVRPAAVRLGDGPRLESLGQCLIGLGLIFWRWRCSAIPSADRGLASLCRGDPRPRRRSR